jgi:hypothetical protein
MWEVHLAVAASRARPSRPACPSRALLKLCILTVQEQQAEFEAQKAATMKLLDRNLSNDEALLTAEGTVGVGLGLVMMFQPKEAHVRPTASCWTRTLLAGDL